MVGGSAAGVVAGSPLFGRPTGRLRLSQNMIEELARQPEHALIFPPGVWRHLTRRAAPGAANIFDELFTDWRASQMLGAEPDDPALTQLISPDGACDAYDLVRREVIIDQLDARVALMQRGRRAFLEDVVARPAPYAAPGVRARVARRVMRSIHWQILPGQGLHFWLHPAP